MDSWGTVYRQSIFTHTHTHILTKCSSLLGLRGDWFDGVRDKTRHLNRGKGTDHYYYTDTNVCHILTKCSSLLGPGGDGLHGVGECPGGGGRAGQGAGHTLVIHWLYTGYTLIYLSL